MAWKMVRQAQITSGYIRDYTNRSGLRIGMVVYVDQPTKAELEKDSEIVATYRGEPLYPEEVNFIDSNWTHKEFPDKKRQRRRR